MTKLKQEEVLRYQDQRRSQETVRRHYLNWRADQNPPIPERCDINECHFYSNPLVWYRRPLKLILDHINGVHGDNRPKILRFLCPNCNSQQSTHGGGNKGRVIHNPGGFAHIGIDGKKQYTMPAETGKYALQFGRPGSKGVGVPAEELSEIICEWAVSIEVEGKMGKRILQPSLSRYLDAHGYIAKEEDPDEFLKPGMPARRTQVLTRNKSWLNGRW